MINLKFLISKKPFINKWRKKALTYLLNEIAPKLSNELNYYLIQDFNKIINSLNKPFQPCANSFKKYEEMYYGLLITEIEVFCFIRSVNKK